MLTWALIFLVVAVIAGIFGYSNVAATAVGFARVLFFLFLVIFTVFLVLWLLGGQSPPIIVT